MLKMYNWVSRDNYTDFKSLCLDFDTFYVFLSSKDMLMRVIAQDLPAESTLVEKVSLHSTPLLFLPLQLFSLPF